MQNLRTKMILPPQQVRLSKVALVVSTCIVGLLSVLSLGFTSKNLTYTKRFTPPSLQPLLQANQIYYYSQVLIILLNILLIVSMIGQCYAAFKLRSKLFLLSVLSNSFTWASGLVSSIVFLCTAVQYTSALKNQYLQMQNNLGSCIQNLCSAADCARLNSYVSTANMQISFCVIVALLGVVTFPLSYIVNINRIQSLEDLEK